MGIRFRSSLLITKNDNFFIFELSMSKDNTPYYVGVPSKSYDEYQIVVDFPEFDMNGPNKNMVIDQVNNAARKAFNKYKNIIYILPNIDFNEKNDALLDNDDNLFTRFHNKVMVYVSNTYWLINTDVKNIPEIINVIVQTMDDQKYIDWLHIYKSNDNFVAIYIDDIPSYFDSGGTALSNSGSVELSNDKPLTKKLVPPKKSSGYATIYYLSILLSTIVLTFIVTYLVLN